MYFFCAVADATVTRSFMTRVFWEYATAEAAEHNPAGSAMGRHGLTEVELLIMVNMQYPHW